MIYQAKLWTEVGQIGETGVHVNVITALEQEHGTELEIVLTQLRHVLEGNNFYKHLIFISI